MRHTVEVEAKFQLPEAEFKAVLARCVVVRQLDQLNIYFDDCWRLADASATCRIRLTRGVARLTVKVPISYEENTRTMLEVEQEIERSELRDLRRAGALRTGLTVKDHFPEEIRQALLSFGVRHLACAGWARTCRYVVEVPGVGEIELDRLRLPNGATIYEVEIEHPNPAVRRQLAMIVQQWAPSARASAVSKFEHFRNALLKTFGAQGWPRKLDYQAHPAAGGSTSD